MVVSIGVRIGAGIWEDSLLRSSADFDQGLRDRFRRSPSPRDIAGWVGDGGIRGEGGFGWSSNPVAVRDKSRTDLQEVSR